MRTSPKTLPPVVVYNSHVPPFPPPPPAYVHGGIDPRHVRLPSLNHVAAFKREQLPGRNGVRLRGAREAQRGHGRGQTERVPTPRAPPLGGRVGASCLRACAGRGREGEHAMPPPVWWIGMKLRHRPSVFSVFLFHLASLTWVVVDCPLACRLRPAAAVAASPAFLRLPCRCIVWWVGGHGGGWGGVPCGALCLPWARVPAAASGAPYESACLPRRCRCRRHPRRCQATWCARVRGGVALWCGWGGDV